MQKKVNKPVIKVYVKEVKILTIAYDGNVSENGVSRQKASETSKKIIFTTCIPIESHYSAIITKPQWTVKLFLTIHLFYNLYNIMASS